MATALSTLDQQDQPDEQLSPEPPIEDQGYGPRNENLPKQLQEAIASAIKKAQGEERYLRRLEVLHDRKLRFYERGFQHIYEGRNDMFQLAVPGATFYDQYNNEQEWGDYIDDYPIFHGFIWIIQSVLTQNGPGIAFQPIDPSVSEDNQAAQTAEGLWKHFMRVNDTKKLMRDMVRMLCVSGRTVVWVKTEESAAKWGRGDDGSPRKNQVGEVFGCLETKVPIMEKDSCNFRYLLIYKDVDVLNAKQDNPHIRAKIKANSVFLDENNYERFARLGILQGGRTQFQAGEAIAHMVTEGHAWLRPSCFADDEFNEIFQEATEDDLIQDEETGESKPPTIRQAIEKIFADKQGSFTGLHATFIGSEYSMAWPESMDDVTLTFKPFSDDGQFAMAIMDPAVVAQDRFNVLMNYCAETFDFGAPSTWVYANKVDFESFIDQKAQPYGLRQMKQLAPNTKAVVDNFFREPDPNIPATLNELVQFLFGEYLQFVLASPPALWGESSEDTKTASGLAQSRNQALGRMGIVWSVLQHACARMAYMVALAASNDPDTPEEIIVPQEGSQNLSVKVERLRKGHFLCTPDEDSGFPDSTAAKRATMTAVFQMIANFPQAAQQIFGAPANWKEFLKLFGIPEMVLPEAESHDKQVEEIEELLNGSPIMPTPEEVQAAQAQSEQAMQAYQAVATQAQATGMPAPPPPPPFDPQSLIRSSVPIKPWDFDQWEMEACDDYLNSDKARVELKVGRQGPDGPVQPNIRGIENVWLHREEHRKAMMMKMPPMPPVPAVAPKGKQPGQQNKPIMQASQPAGSPGTATV